MRLMALLNERKWALGAALLLTAFAFLFWGLAGARTVAGFALLVVLPFYILLGMLNLQEPEKLMFAFCAGITIFPSVAYWLGFVIPFSNAIWLTSALCFALATGTRFFLRKQRQ